MTTRQNLELIRRVFEDGWNRQLFDYLEGRTAGEIRFHYNGHSMDIPGDSLPDFVARWRAAFPDLKMDIRHLIAQDDLVAVSLVLRATHRGEWHGVPPAGNSVEVEETMFFRFENDVLVEMWELFDEHTLWRQIGRDQ